MKGSEAIGLVWISTGGPRTLSQVEPFVRRMLSDPLVMPLPWPLRQWLAWRIARRRGEAARARYLRMGLPSPVLVTTETQARRLERLLGDGWLVEAAFRYAQPEAEEAVIRLAARGAGRILALPAFPQWSRPTSLSAARAVERASARAGLACTCGPSFSKEEGFLQALVEGARPLMGNGVEVLFCAHGLPLNLVRAGDPYLRQVEETVAAVAERLGISRPRLAFQGRLGRAEWTRPYVEESIVELGSAGIRSLLLVPVSFICENLETLVELDLEAAESARRAGIEAFARAPVPTEHEALLRSLASLARRVAEGVSWFRPRDAHSLGSG